MTDNLAGTGNQDKTRIDINQEEDLQYWSNEYGVSEERLKAAVKAVGVMIADIKRYLQK
jgi:hypothetical protein